MRISAWGFFDGPFDFVETPLGPIGCKVIIHKNTNTRKSWDKRGREGYNIGPSLEHYQCLCVVYKQTKEFLISYTV